MALGEQGWATKNSQGVFTAMILEQILIATIVKSVAI
jgi:hypothetical protein